MPHLASHAPGDRPSRSRIAVPAAVLRVAPPPRLVLFNAHGWQADLAHAHTVYVARADNAALRSHLRRLVHSPAAVALPPDGAAWALLEALHGEAAAVLAADATPTAAHALSATLHLLVARLAWDPAPLLDALAPTVDAPETLAVAAAVYAAVLAAAAGLREPEPLVLLALLAIATDRAAGDAATADRAETLRRLGLRAPALGPRERSTLAIARAFVQLTAAGDDATPLDHYDALLALAAHPERFDPRLLRTFVRVLGAEPQPADAADRRVA